MGYSPISVAVMKVSVTRSGMTSFLMRNAGTQKEWITSFERILRMHGAIQRDVQLGGSQVLFGIVELPGVLRAQDLDDHLFRIGPLGQRQHLVAERAKDDDHEGRDEGPDDFQAGVTANGRAIGFVVGLAAEANDRVEQEALDDDEDGGADAQRDAE